jgi:hypothetical protein
MTKTTNPPKLSRHIKWQLRALYPTFFLSPIVCLTFAIWLAFQHQPILAVGFAIFALVLFPAMWRLYRPSNKIIEQTITECDQLMNGSVLEDELMRASQRTATAQKELLRAASADTTGPAEELLRANDIRSPQDHPAETLIQRGTSK